MLSFDQRDAVRSTVLAVLASKLRDQGRNLAALHEETKLLELGLIDSEDLIAIILEVEERCECEFDPAEMDFEDGLTLGALITCFAVRR
jgi:acyl carrier protein